MIENCPVERALRRATVFRPILMETAAEKLRERRKSGLGFILVSLMPAHSGILSCFFHGFSSCLSRSFRNPSATRRRVECGMITSSM